MNLSTQEFIIADRHIDLLAEMGNKLRDPHSKSLGEGLFELRFTMSRQAWRITYWFAPRQLIVLLTVFRKRRNNEQHEIERAHQALKQCKEDHM
jgi:phage-related protein